MAADIVPVRLGLTKGDLYTLWAPLWRDSEDEWQAFLGDDEDLFAFESVADLVAFVRSGTANDLVDHPAWPALTGLNAHALDPADAARHDLIGVPELVADKPTEESVTALLGALTVVQAIGSVCDLAAVSKFFNGNPVLASLGGGVEAFGGRTGRKRWGEIEAVIARSWDGVVDAIDAIVTVPDVDEAAATTAREELAEPAPEPDDPEDETSDDEAASSAGDTAAATDATAATDADESAADPAATALAAQAENQLLGSDEDFWAQVGIDPIRIMGRSATYYSLRCYYDDEPRFLGRNGRISVFGSERSLARYLADEHDSDLSGFATYEDIRTAATDGSLRIRVGEENVYVLRGLADDIADGPDAVDRDQLELAVELIRDVAEYAEDPSIEDLLDPGQPLGGFIAHALGVEGASTEDAAEPSTNYAKAVEQWERVESFLESRLREE